MSKIVLQEESVYKVAEEVTPLLREHWQEVTPDHNRELNVDWLYYFKAESLGHFVGYSARYNGELIGYLAYFIHPHPHYKQEIVGKEDVFFILPKYRTGSLGIRLMKFAEQELKLRGVTLLLQHSKVHKPIDAILKRMNYKPVDTLFIKSLGESHGN